MEVDYIVVGFGLAGISLTYQLQSRGKKVLVIDGSETKASIVAAGLYNPVVLKRFTLAWKADEYLKYAKLFFEDISSYLKINTTVDLPIYRKFATIEEQNKWFQSIDNPKLSKHLSPYLKDIPKDIIDSNYKYGEVQNTGRVFIKDIFEKFSSKLNSENSFLKEEFDYNSLKLEECSIRYKNIRAKKIIFCEGHKLKENPFFNYLPLVGSKGSYLIIKSPKLKLKVAVKSYYYIIPLGNDLYKFGATYEHNHKKDHDQSAFKALKESLEELMQVPFEIVKQIVGVRPTVKDRRPLLGRHPKYPCLNVYNGLGTRGVMLAPTMSFLLSNYLIDDNPLSLEIDIKRFEDLYT